MSCYRNKLQEALLRNSPTHNSPTHNFYAVCEAVGYATLVAGYLLTIAAHL